MMYANTFPAPTVQGPPYKAHSMLLGLAWFFGILESISYISFILLHIAPQLDGL